MATEPYICGEGPSLPSVLPSRVLLLSKRNDHVDATYVEHPRVGGPFRGASHVAHARDTSSRARTSSRITHTHTHAPAHPPPHTHLHTQDIPPPRVARRGNGWGTDRVARPRGPMVCGVGEGGQWLGTDRVGVATLTASRNGYGYYR